MRRTEFANGEYYHIYNRGVDKCEVFLDDKDYYRFLKSMKEFNTLSPIGSLHLKEARNRVALSGSTAKALAVEPLLVQIIAYCLNPNHYHFILRQEADGGIPEFMKRLSGGYTWYFNQKNSRSGALFQGRYKSIHIDSNEYLLLLSVYVNANYEIHSYPEKEWAYSSYLDYVGKRKGKLCEKEIILGQFENSFSEYEKYMQDNMLYFKDKKEECVLE